jgi:lipopolysaccharide/colanic/teichoic acid biosynthesis glycosyltransferase
MYRIVGKRFLDLLLTLPALMVLAPLIALVGALVRWRIGSPVLFRHQRAGYGGRPFEALKFRSMLELRDEAGQQLPDADRLTSFGRFLRASSLDELPSLWNVLRGDMSLVGPRPLAVRYLPRYSPRQARRHDVKPGVTGLAQVRGRNRISWDEKFQYDVTYVENLSFWLDLKILALTLLVVVRRDGISAEGEATMPEFFGAETPDAPNRKSGSLHASDRT